MNKLILFDWGNIVESHQTGYTCYDAWNELFNLCGYSKLNIFEKIKKYKLSSIKDIDTFSKTYDLIKKEFNLNKTFEEFVSLYKKTFDKVDYYKDVKDYELSLKDKCYIGILSNLNILEKERLDRQVGLSNYDYVFLSFEFGKEKPDIEFYEEVQSRIPFEPSDILFIDDRKDNIEIASKMGWNTLLATGLELDKIKSNVTNFLKNT